MPALLHLQDIFKSFGSLQVLAGITLSLAPGEALGIIGPNGAGKTTLLDVVAGGLRAEQGRVVFDGVDVTAEPQHLRCRRGIGRSYQIPHPFAKMTVFENVLAGAVFGAGGREAQSHRGCLEILHTTGLLARGNALAGALSLLERKRLELARALATGPRLLLLDEIAGGLTDAECDALIGTILQIRASGTGIVWIEHVMHALSSVVDRMVMINFGRVVADGPPHQVMADPEVQETYMGIEAG